VAFQRKKTAAIGRKAPFPGFVEPALATSVDKVPAGDRWIHQIKFDGYRVQLHIHNDAFKVFTRRGNDWTRRFSKIEADDAYLINAGSANLVVPFQLFGIAVALLHYPLGLFERAPQHGAQAGRTGEAAEQDLDFSIALHSAGIVQIMNSLASCQE